MKILRGLVEHAFDLENWETSGLAGNCSVWNYYGFGAMDFYLKAFLKIREQNILY